MQIKQSVRSFFTLVELVVIVFTSVLLLTALISLTGCGEDSQSTVVVDDTSAAENARESRAKSTHCVGKLKQFGLAIMMYGYDNKEYIPAWDGSNKHTMATNDNHTYQLGATTAKPFNKLLLGGYMGSNLQHVDKKIARQCLACPSDKKIFDAKSASSYIYMPLYQNSAKAKRRMIIGRDNPGAALVYDVHSSLVPENTGGAADLPENGGNHPAEINVLYLGGHTASVSAQAAVDFSAIDQITY